MYNKIIVYGLGLSGRAVLKFLSATKNIKIILVDKKKIGDDFSSDDRIIDCTGERYCDLMHGENISDIDCMFVSPGIPPSDPLIMASIGRNITLKTELDIARELIQKDQKLICVTGTNGKSTITSWIADSLNVIPCGNIGVPILSHMMAHPDDRFVVCELSSFQLAHSSVDLSPHIAIINDLGEDHIEWHGSIEEYHRSKGKITNGQTENDWLLLSDKLSDEYVRWIANNTKARIIFVGADDPRYNDIAYGRVYIREHRLMMRIQDKEIELLSDINAISLIGRHNLENMMFVSCTYYLTSIISEVYSQSKVIAYKGLEHRLERFHEIASDDDKKHIVFFNDSKATNPESTITALKAIKDHEKYSKYKLFWIGGGLNKNLDVCPMMNMMLSMVSEVFLYGRAKSIFRDAMLDAGYDDSHIYFFDTLGECVQCVNDLLDIDKYIILFSPACASFDQFDNFEHRGKVFKELISEKFHKGSLNIERES